MRARGLITGGRLALTTLVLLLSTVVAPRADAAIPAALGPNTRPMFGVFAMGGAISINDSVSQFKISQEFGYHFFGAGVGPALGVGLQESFGNNSFLLQLGPRFWWDFQPVADLGLYLAPVGQLGFAIWSWDSGYSANPYYDRDGDSRGFFNMQFGFEARLVIGNRGLVYFRPFTMDIFLGETSGVRYDVMFGGGVTF